MEFGILQKQEQTISPQMVQTMEILPMNTAELREYLENAALENPVIELEIPDSIDSQIVREMLWLEKTNRGSRQIYEKTADSDRLDPAEKRGQSVIWEESLETHLKEQLFCLKLPEHIDRAAMWVISNLNEKGWYESDGLSNPFDPATIDEALRIVRSMDPPGVGACDLKDCLLLQLQRMDGDTSLQEEIVSGHLDDMAKSRFHHIATALGVSQKKIREACEVIRTLNPKPASSFSSSAATEYIRPDAVIFMENGEAKVALVDYELPALKLNPYYCDLVRETDSPQVEEYLKDKIKQVYMLQQSLKQRHSTVVNCFNVIAKIQKAYLNGGDIVPMTLRDVAELAELHESTVSRAISGKYIQCSRGVFPVKSLFSRAIHSESGGPASAINIKATISQLIDSEDKLHPLSDQQICDSLKTKGMDLSRRTVAKYRSELNIPPATGRKK